MERGLDHFSIIFFKCFLTYSRKIRERAEVKVRGMRERERERERERNEEKGMGFSTKPIPYVAALT